MHTTAVIRTDQIDRRLRPPAPLDDGATSGSPTNPDRGTARLLRRVAEAAMADVARTICGS